MSFLPLLPGVRQDALTAKDAVGDKQVVALLRGIGLAPRLVFSPGVISTFAGNGAWGYVNSPVASAASFRNPQGVASDSAGNIYVADSINMVIRKINAATRSVTTIAGNGFAGYSGDGGLAVNATLNTPTGVAVDAAGNLYIADQGNSLVRTVNALSGLIWTIAGGGTAPAGGDGLGDGLSATSAILSGPNHVALDGAGNIFIADSFHSLIRKVSAATGIISVVAGGGSGGGSDGLGDNGPATAAMLSDPNGIALDAAGNLYIADSNNSLVRMVNASTGNISVVAGTGAYGSSGDGGLAVNARLAAPAGVTLDAAGNLYIADFGNNRIREVSAASGLIVTLSGASAGYAGDGGPSNRALLNTPTDLVFGADGNLYIADYSNNVIRQITFGQPPLSFPATNVGTISPSSNIVLTNIGNASLAITAITLTAGFSQVPSGVTDCAISALLPASSCSVGVAFAPSSAGAVSGSLKLITNQLNLPASLNSVSLSGTGTAGTPQANLSANSLTFAVQTVGTASTVQNVTLTNAGTAALAISNIWLSGANATDFILTSSCPSSLAASASCVTAITFKPQVAGPRTAVLTFSDSLASSPQTVTLMGTGSGGALVSFNPASVGFGSLVVGVQSPALSVVVTNTGIGALSIYGIALGGANGSDFSIASSTCGSSLNPSANCTVSLAFTPGAPGARSATLTFTDSAGNSPQAVSLSGTGTAPSLSVTPAVLNFGSLVVGTKSAAQSVTLSVASGAVALSGSALSGANAADFSITGNTCASTLANGSSCSVSLTFAPAAVGARSATLTFTNSAGNSPQAISVSGSGVIPSLSIAPAALNFGSQVQGIASANQSVALSNTSGAGVTFSGLTMAGSNSSDFAITGNTCAATLANGSTCSVVVAFTPRAVGARSATLLFTSSGANSPQPVSLSGTGMAPTLIASPAALSFGSLAVSIKSASQTVTLSNTSGGAVTLTQMALTGPNSADFASIANTCTTTLANGAICSVAVAFTPGAIGTRSATLVFTNSAGNSPQSVTLSGTGVVPMLTVAPAAASFGTLLVGTKSTAQSVTLSNTSGANVTFNSFALAGVNSPDFSITSNTCGTALASGSSCSASLVSTPAAAGNRSASLIVADNAPASPQTIALSGTGAVSSPAQASFQKFDTTTQGTWKGVYGSDGYSIANLATSFPSYTIVGVNGASLYTWVPSTTSLVGLQKPDPATDRIASAYYATASFTFDVNLTDGQPHQLALYCLDLDVQHRSENISIFDAASGALLDSRNLANFSTGTYATWNLQGHVLVQVTNTDGSNAVVSGLFFAPASGSGPPPPTIAITSPSAGAVSGTVTLAANATAAAGIASVQFQLDGTSLNAPLTGSGASYSIQWATGSASSGSHLLTAIATDTLGQKTASAAVAVSIAGSLVSASAAFVKLDTSTAGSWRGVYGQDGYIIANDSNVLPAYAAAATNLAGLFTWNQSTSDTRALQKGANPADRIESAFYSATNFVVDINLTDGQPHQVAFYCLDADGNDRSQVLTVRDGNSAAVLDTRSVSNFQNGVYVVWNLQGHVTIEIADTSGPNAVVSGIFFATIGGSSSAQVSTVAITAPASGNVSGMVTVTANVSSVPGLASVQFQLNGANLGAPVTGSGPSFSTQWDTTTASPGAHLLTAVASVTGGQNTASAAVSVNVGTGASSAASFLKLDTVTQGNWKGVYGQNGYVIANDSRSFPGYASVNVTSASQFTWSASSTDVRSLLKAESTTDRIASAFYATSTFTFDVNLTDGQSHQLALYCLDLDTTTRNQRISIINPATSAVLDSRNLTNFHNGVYAVWNIAGHVLIQVINNGGLNAVVSGLFF